ncbi:MAG: ABC transporter ATP-binding protein [Bacteroidales bacterium]
MKYILKASNGYRGRILLSALLGVCSVLVSLGFIWASKRVIDIATGDLDADFLHAALITAGLLLIQLILHPVNQWLTIRLQSSLSNTLRSRIFDNLMKSAWNQAERFPTGDLMTRVMQENSEIVRLLVNTLPRILLTSVELGAAFFYLYWLNKGLAVTLLLITPLFLLLSKTYYRKMRFFSKEIKKTESRLHSLMQESFTHRTVLKTLEYVPRQINRLESIQQRLYGQICRRGNISIFSQSLIWSGFACGGLIAFIWGSVQIRDGLITFGTMTAFLQLANKIQNPSLDLLRLIPGVISTLTASERIAELNELVREPEGDLVGMKGDITVSMENVSFSYKAEKEVLTNVNMVFPPDTMTAITGETGVGKTTLLRLLLGLVTPSAGKINLSNGNEIHPVSSLTRNHFIYVPQGNTLFGTTIRQNLLMGNPSATTAELHEALHTAAAEFVFELPGGLDTRIGERGMGLSEGQAQRIAIARALLRPGKVVVMDEPTSALDTATEEVFLKRLKTKMANRTVIFITHHPALANSCDRVYQL